MNVEGQYNPKDVECISVENLEVLPSGVDWQSRHLESERRKAEIRDRIHKQAEQGQKTAKDYFRPAKPTPSIYDSDLKRVAVYARVSTSSEEQISSIENQTLYYTKKIAETENWNLQDIYSDEGKSGTSLRKRDAFKRMLFDLEEAIMFTPKPQEYTDPLTGEMKKKQIKFFPDVYKDRIGKSYNDYISGHQMNLFEDFIGYQGSAVLDEPEQKTDTISVPIPQCEESENIPLPDLSEQPENVQRPGSEIAERGMQT